MTDNTLDSTRKYIDGPVNVARLEGKIDGIKKVIYLFMDYHLNLGTEQRQCSNIFSTNIRKYFVDSFSETSKGDIVIDFFMEFNKDNLIKNKYKGIQQERSMKYIWDISHMLSKISDYDLSKNKIISSNIFKKLRIHYMDIRDNRVYNTEYYTKYQHKYDILVNNLMQTGVVRYYNYEDFNNLTNDYIDTLNMIYDIIKNDTKPKNDLLHELYNTIKKIREKYNDNNIKKKINKYLGKILLFINKIKSQLSELMKKIESNIISEEDISGRKFDATGNRYTMSHNKYDITSIINEITKLLRVVDNFDMLIYVLLTDLFMLRRFLDKKYITNGIAYTGMGHSENYMYILLKEFDFKITHISYSGISLNELNKKIKSESNYYENITNNELYLKNYNQYIVPDNMSQCSDLTDFPKNFT